MDPAAASLDIMDPVGILSYMVELAAAKADVIEQVAAKADIVELAAARVDVVGALDQEDEDDEQVDKHASRLVGDGEANGLAFGGGLPIGGDDDGGGLPIGGDDDGDGLPFGGDGIGDGLPFGEVVVVLD